MCCLFSYELASLTVWKTNMADNNSQHLFSQMIYLGLLGHSHIRRLLRHWHPNDNIWPIGLPGHTHLLQYMHNDITDDSHYTHIISNHPHLGAILIAWGDNEMDQPGDTIKNGITYDIVHSLTYRITSFFYTPQYSGIHHSTSPKTHPISHLPSTLQNGSSICHSHIG